MIISSSLFLSVCYLLIYHFYLRRRVLLAFAFWLFTHCNHVRLNMLQSNQYMSHINTNLMLVYLQCFISYQIKESFIHVGKPSSTLAACSHEVLHKLECAENVLYADNESQPMYTNLCRLSCYQLIYAFLFVNNILWYIKRKYIRDLG